MKSGKIETVVLLLGIIITVVILFSVLITRSKINTANNLISVTPSINPIMEEQIVSEIDKSIDAGLSLEITSPVDGTTVFNPNINVSGKTEAGADVFINEKELKADLQGNFIASLILEEGENIIVVTAGDDDGNYSERTLVITYELAETF